MSRISGEVLIYGGGWKISPNKITGELEIWSIFVPTGVNTKSPINCTEKQ